MNNENQDLKNKDSFNICVIGSGYVGLVAAACFCKLGNDVVCVDNDEEKVKTLKDNKIPNYEPGLEELVKAGINSKKLTFATSIAEGVEESEIIFIAVGTPSKNDGKADMAALEKVGREIAEHLNSYKLIVEKSTVPVRTGLKLRKTIEKYSNQSAEFDIASNPEFLREGKAISDFLEPDRIVLGVESKKAGEILKKLYSKVEAQILFTDVNTAEIIKHASNSFLATKISFINAVANLCEKTNADIDKVALGMGLDKRIGKQFLKAGLGFGGSCFPKDLSAFIHIAEKYGVDFKLLRQARNINYFQRKHFIKKIEEELWVLKGKTIGVLGLSFKPDTDDLREAPAIDIVSHLISEGSIVKVYDPKAMEKAKPLLKGAVFCDNVYEVVEDADCLALMTEWSEFGGLDFEKIKNKMKVPFVADGRNFFDPEKLKKLGFKYIGMGR